MSIRIIGAGSRARMLCGSALLGVLLGTSAAAHAQSGVDSSRVEDSAAESDTEIVVTGTSISGIPPTGSGLISVSRRVDKIIGAPCTPEWTAHLSQSQSLNTTPRTHNP